MVPAGNKAKRLSSVYHTTKTIHHIHHLHLWEKNFLCVYKFYCKSFLRAFGVKNCKCYLRRWQWKKKGILKLLWNTRQILNTGSWFTLGKVHLFVLKSVYYSSKCFLFFCWLNLVARFLLKVQWCKWEIFSFVSHTYKGITWKFCIVKQYSLLVITQ